MAAVLFASLGVIIFFSPKLIYGLSDSSRMLFAGLLVLYAAFRFFTFYTEYKNLRDEE